jgi:hypothetical protein
MAVAVAVGSKIGMYDVTSEDIAGGFISTTN